MSQGAREDAVGQERDGTGDSSEEEEEGEEDSQEEE